MKAAMIAVLAMVACCGTQSSASAINPAFAGSWNVNASVTGAAFSPTNKGVISTYSSTLLITPSGASATVAHVCPDGSGTVTVNGTDNGPAGSGQSLNCPALALGNCASVVPTFTLVTVELLADGTLRALAAGVADGCAALKAPLAIAFSGTRSP